MPRKGENIYKRKDGRWEARYIKQRTPDGKAVYGYVYAKSYKEAKSKAQKCLVAVVNSLATSASSQQHQESSSFEYVANECCICGSYRQGTHAWSFDMEQCKCNNREKV